MVGMNQESSPKRDVPSEDDTKRSEGGQGPPEDEPLMGAQEPGPPGQDKEIDGGGPGPTGEDPERGGQEPGPLGEDKDNDGGGPGQTGEDAERSGREPGPPGEDKDNDGGGPGQTGEDPERGGQEPGPPEEEHREGQGRTQALQQRHRKGRRWRLTHWRGYRRIRSGRCSKRRNQELRQDPERGGQ